MTPAKIQGYFRVVLKAEDAFRSIQTTAASPAASATMNITMGEYCGTTCSDSGEKWGFR